MRDYLLALRLLSASVIRGSASGFGIGSSSIEVRHQGVTLGRLAVGCILVVSALATALTMGGGRSCTAVSMDITTVAVMSGLVMAWCVSKKAVRRS